LQGLLESGQVAVHVGPTLQNREQERSFGLEKSSSFWGTSPAISWAEKESACLAGVSEKQAINGFDNAS
jgi:hypothetical protein